MQINNMEPLILIVAAGQGKRLLPITEDTPKAFVDIGDRKLIDLVMEPLPAHIEKSVLLSKTKKFGQLERHLRENYGFNDNNVLYQDRITTSPYLPKKLNLSELPLAYYLEFFPPIVSKNSKFLRQFEPIILVPGDVIVNGLDYMGLMRFHTINGADVTMPVKDDFVEGSNTRIYTVKDGRLTEATAYIKPPLNRELPENEKRYTSVGAYVLGRKFFDLPWYKLIRKDHRVPDFAGVFKSLRFFPYEGTFEWIDVRDHTNLKKAIQRYRKG